MNKQVNYGRFLHGGDYNPEQWMNRPDILRTDIEYFKKSHINTVSLGIFSWSVLEPNEGEYHFEWLEEIIDTMYHNGISVILATPSGARPKWMSDKYPEVLRVNENRERNLFGGRHNHCYTSPVYREKTRRINMELAKRFGQHPAVILWHISNEFGGECHCPLCQEEFRKWLEEKYQTIEALNECWATTFWSHRYNSFSQIESPSPRGESGLHALTLDWKRFVTERTIDFLKHEVQAIRDGGSDKPVTANLMYDYAGLDYKKFREALDIVSWDNYPSWHKHTEWKTALDCGLQHDLMRSIQNRPFLLMESCPSATNWQPVSKLKKPGMLLTASLQAVAHGSDSVLYFQLRQSQGSSEKFHGAVIDHYGGCDTRVFREVTEVGNALEQIQEITGSHTVSPAAILYDRENDWAMKDSQGPRNEDLHYMECIQKHYQALRNQGINTDIISMEHDLQGYQIVAAPMSYMHRRDYAQKLASFVENGGTLVLTYWSGIVDETDLCYLEGTPHGLMEVTGIRSTEIDALYDWEENHAVPENGNHLGLSSIYTCKNFCDLVQPIKQKPDVEILLRYADDFYQGWPALTHHAFGKGHAYYVCADLEEAFYGDFYPQIIKEAHILSPLESIPEGVSVTTRENDSSTYLFVQNFGTKAVSVPIPAEYKLLYGDTEASMKPLTTRIFKKAR
ncbi:MAG: beta-galactosidase [Lachnospiraceae bacterium]|nr:beta-galactosidase [Lachnospiraceae bacterium]